MYKTTHGCKGARGATVFLLVVLLLILLVVSAFAIDLAIHYVARSEAQRAADAAALAGAFQFVRSGFFSGFATQTEAEDKAREEAKTVASQNLVGGAPAQVQDADVSFDFSTPENPRITVVVQRTTARGNAMPTFFAKAVGIAEADISAQATAEAFSPSGGNIPVGTGCVKPWILPNCDPSHTSPENPNCPGSAYFVDPSTGDVVYPGSVGNGGVIGANLLLKTGQPQDSPAPGQFYPVQIPPGTAPALCPECAQTPGGSEGPGAALYRHNISCCNTNQFVCGQQAEIDEQTGNMVGPTRQGVQCLIHQVPQNCGNPTNCGQDYIPNPTGNPFEFTGGSNNPNPLLQGQQISSSDSVVTIPLYAGYPLSPGESGALPTVTVVGFLQVFIEKVGVPQGTVRAFVLNVAGCGSGGSGGGSGSGSGGGSGEDGSGSGSGGPITGPGGSPFPIRLVRPSS